MTYEALSHAGCTGFVISESEASLLGSQKFLEATGATEIPE